MDQFSKLNRRQLIQWATASSLLPLAASPVWAASSGKAAAKMVVIGGGFGGSAVAKYLKRYNPELEVTLIEPSTQYITCPGSNWVLGGLKPMQEITHTYEGLKKRGIKMVHEMVESVDFAAKKVKLANGSQVAYDKLVVSPGIDFKWDVHAGVNSKTPDSLPHAYKAGAQTTLLRRQMESMPNGGTFLMVAPPNPFRCPPGPYERAGMVAHYFKMAKPNSKILILDQKNSFSKQGLFMEGWEAEYGDMIQWVSASDGGKVDSIDVANKVVKTADGESHKADVINYIPPQKAGALAFKLGLTNQSGFCPVDQRTFESTVHKDVFVVGDSSIAGAMPKSGHSATSQAKICAANIVRAMEGLEPVTKKNVNTCYSLIAPDYAVSVAAVYDFIDGSIKSVPNSGGVSPKGADRGIRAQEAMYTQGWYKSITNEVWG